jgi:hypothetical protein
MLTGAHPFSSIVVGRAAPDAVAAPTVGARDTLARLDARWVAFFEEALSVDPARRPPTGAAFSARLEGILLP